MIRTLFFLAFFSFSFSAFSQNFDSPSSYTPKNFQEYTSLFDKNLASSEKKAEKSKYKKELNSVYSNRHKDLTQKLMDEYFIFHPYYQAYIDSVAQVILAANPSIPAKKVNILISRSGVPNAFSYGDGIIVINLGLLRRVPNEAQLAFILAHEMAHFTENHIERFVQSNLDFVQKTDLEKKAKKVSKKNRFFLSEYKNLFEDFVFSTSRTRRNHEYEADSIGFSFFKRTNYALTEASKAVLNLDSLDFDKYPVVLPYESVLGSAHKPFKQSWLEKEEFIFGGAVLDRFSLFDQDSTRTHPECQERAAVLKRQVDQIQVADSNSIRFNRLVDWADYEMVKYYFDFWDVGLSLHEGLHLLNKNPSDERLIQLVGDNMLQVIYAIQDHKLSEYVAFERPIYSESYNNTLRFLHQIRLKDMIALTHGFLEKKASESTHKEVLLLYVEASLLTQQDELIEEAEARWEAVFPNDNYKQYFKTSEK